MTPLPMSLRTYYCPCTFPTCLRFFWVYFIITFVCVLLTSTYSLPRLFQFRITHSHSEYVASLGVPGLGNTAPAAAAATTAKSSKVCCAYMRFLKIDPTMNPALSRHHQIQFPHPQEQARLQAEAEARSAALKAALSADDFESASEAASKARKAASADGSSSSAGEASKATDPAKRQRNLKKKLDAIAALEVSGWERCWGARGWGRDGSSTGVHTNMFPQRPKSPKPR